MYLSMYQCDFCSVKLRKQFSIKIIRLKSEKINYILKKLKNTLLKSTKLCNNKKARGTLSKLIKSIYFSVPHFLIITLFCTF